MAHRLLPLEALDRRLPLDLVGTIVEPAGPGGIVRVDWSGGERNRPLAVYSFCNCKHCREGRAYVPLLGALGPWDPWLAREICYVSASDNEGCGFSIIFTDRKAAKWMVCRYLRTSKPPRRIRCPKDRNWDGRRSQNPNNYERGTAARVTFEAALQQLIDERGIWTAPVK
jgi:hypothetical protein